MRQYLTGEKFLDWVRVLIIVEIVVMLVSTAAAVGIEGLIYLLFILSAELRKRFVASLRQPMVMMSMLWYAVITAGLLYGLASWEEGVDFWSSWRKLLLVPLTVSVFEDPRWKRRLIITFIGAAFLAALISAGSYFFDIEVYHRFDVGIALTNHATQGIVFAMAIFASFVLLKFFPSSAKGFRITILGMVIIAINLFFITPGRSGYLAFLIFGTFSIFVSVKGIRRWLLFAALPVAIGLLLAISPVAKEKIMTGFSEVTNLEKADKFSSMGIRMVMWKNTVAILKDRDFPFLVGYGTGGFKEAYRPQVAGQTGWKAEVVDDCHNQYLLIAVEHGAIGLLIFLGFIAACFKQRAPQPFKILGTGALLSWCATSLFSGHFGTFTEGRLIYIWMGAMLAMPAAAPAGSRPVVARP